MSLLSTFTSDSINGWRAISSAGYSTGNVIHPNIPVNDSRFGYNCIISGDGTRCAVKTWYSVSGTNYSNTYIFLKDSGGAWVQETIFTTINPYSFDVPMVINYAGDVLVMPVYPTSLRIYTRVGTTWSLSQTITHATTAEFGYSIAISVDGNYIFEGQSSYNSNRGRIVVYSKSGSTWVQASIITPSDPAAGAQFANSLAINNDTNYLIVGCKGTNSNNGAVYVYIGGATTWTQQTKINSPFGTNNGGAANTVTINNDGTYLSFGFNSTTLGINSRIWVYNRSGTTWTLQATVYSGSSSLDDFGVTVNLSGDASILIASARATIVSGSIDAGTIYVFNRIGSSWLYQQTLTTTPIQANTELTQTYGLDISNDGNTIIGGAPGINNYGTNAGAVFTYII